MAGISYRWLGYSPTPPAVTQYAYFGRRYWGARYFGARYWADGGSGAGVLFLDFVTVPAAPDPTDLWAVDPDHTTRAS